MRNVRVILVVALAIIATLVIHIYWHQHTVDEQRRTTSATMRLELLVLRRALPAYRARYGRAPEKLSDLVGGGVISHVPVDPVTHSAATWKTELEEVVRTDDFRAAATPAPKPGIIDVKSGAPGSDAQGKRWSDY